MLSEVQNCSDDATEKKHIKQTYQFGMETYQNRFAKAL